MAGRLSVAKKEELIGQAVALSVKGYGYVEIAEKLELHRNTVGAWVKNEIAQRSEHAVNEKEMAKAHYREVIRAAWESYEAVDVRSLNKSGHLNVAIRAQERIDKIDGNDAPKKFSGELTMRRFTLSLGDREIEVVDGIDSAEYAE